MKNKTILYYDVLGLGYNNSEVVKFNEGYFYSKSIVDKIFRVGKDGKYINEYDLKDEVPNHKTKEELGRIQAENEFHNIMKEISSEYEFQYIDYFRSETFVDDDFDDVSHLTFNGAKKFTKILNEVSRYGN